MVSGVGQCLDLTLSLKSFLEPHFRCFLVATPMMREEGGAHNTVISKEFSLTNTCSPPLLSLVSFPGVHEGLMSKGHMSWETDSEHFLVNSTSQSLLTITLLSAGISIEIEVPL